MEIRYSREMNHNYMIIEAPEKETGYAVQMLSANAIEGLLKFRVRQNICIWIPIILLWNYVWFRGIGKRRRRRSQNCWGIFWNVRIIRIGRLLY